MIIRFIYWGLYYKFDIFETLFRWTVDYGGWIFAATDFMTIVDALEDDVNLAIWVPFMVSHVVAEWKFWQLRPLILDFIELDNEITDEQYDAMFEDW